MGQKNSTEEMVSRVPLTQANFNPEVEVLQKTYDPHYGEIKLVRDVKTAEKFVLKEVTVNSKGAFETEQAFFNNRVSLKHPNVVNIVGYNSQDKHNFCSTYYKLSLFLENLEQHLKNDLDARKDTNNAYTDSELLFIADDLISGLSYFQSQGVSHGDIRPLNVFVKDGLYKLSDPSLNAQKGSNALTHAIVQGTKTLLSPLLIKHVPQNKFDLDGDQYKNDVYSLGATLLSLATLTDSEDLYDYKEGTLNEALVNERLETVRRTRNPLTHELIQSMLHVDETGRPDFISLSNRILPHRDQIRSGTYGGLNQGSTIDYLYGKTETAKRSAMPTDDTLARAERQLADSRGVYTNTNTYTYQAGGNDFGTDDLEAKIKAALARSEATFRAVTAANTGADGTTTTTTTYNYSAPQQTSTYEYSAPQQTSTYEYSAPQQTSTYTPQQTSSYNYTAPQGESAKRSALPAETYSSGTYGDSLKKSNTPATYTYTTTSYAAPEGDALKKSNPPNAYTSYSTGAYNPSSYNYSATVPAGDANAGTTNAYTSSATYTPGVGATGGYTAGTTGGYGTTSYAAPEGDALKKSNPPNAYTSYSTGSFNPSAYNYSATVPAGDANAGTTTTYTTSATYTPGTAGGYSSTYTPGQYSTGATYGQTAGQTGQAGHGQTGQSGTYTSGGYTAYQPSATYAGAGTTGGNFSESVNQYSYQTTV